MVYMRKRNRACLWTPPFTKQLHCLEEVARRDLCVCVSFSQQIRFGRKALSGRPYSAQSSFNAGAHNTLHGVSSKVIVAFNQRIRIEKITVPGPESFSHDRKYRRRYTSRGDALQKLCTGYKFMEVLLAWFKALASCQKGCLERATIAVAARQTLKNRVFFSFLVKLRARLYWR